jgi:hypothetical protein
LAIFADIRRTSLTYRRLLWVWGFRLGVFSFDQTHLDNARQISRLIRQTQGAMTVPNNDKFEDYARYADHCLNMVAATPDQELRRIQREMAAEWLRLADVVRRPRRSKQMQMG